MAEEEPIQEQNESNEMSAEPEVAEKAPRKFKLPKPVLLAGIVLAMLGFQFFASRLLIKKMFFTGTPSEAKAEEVNEEVGEFYMIEELIINPAATGGRRHLLVSLGLEFHDPLLKEELSKRDPQIRDNLITLLAGQEVPVLTDIRYREDIRKSLLEAINYHLKEAKVERLYFVKYVFQ